MTQSKPRRTLCIEPADVDRLLHEMNRECRTVSSSKRQSMRLALRRNDCQVLLWQGGAGGQTHHFRSGIEGEVDVWRSDAASAKAFVMESRNISIQGISLLHGVFVHPGVRCRVTLTTVDGNRRDLDGVVVACRYLRGGAHELGVRFDSVIRLRDFCPDAEAMLPDFLADLQARAESLAKALEADDATAIRSLSEVLRSRAHGYGFEKIEQGAAGLRRTLESAGDDIEKMRRGVQELIELCRWTDAPSASAAAGSTRKDPSRSDVGKAG